MIKIDILSVVPKLMESYFKHSIMQRAINKGLLEINLIDIRDFATNKQKNVDDYSYGGDAGMVLMIEPIYNAIISLKQKNTYDEIIYFTPDAQILNQKIANFYSLKKKLLILCGHYKGIDQRIRDHLITKELSIGNFVLSGGEIPATLFTDAIVRLIPGVLNDETSALNDSFQNDIIAPPIYTRPSNFNNWEVPKVLLNGNHSEIKKWQEEQSKLNTSKFFKN